MTGQRITKIEKNEQFFLFDKSVTCNCTFSRNQGRAPQWSKWKLKMEKTATTNDYMYLKDL